MKLSDYVIHYLAELGIKHVFVVTGGYAVNLIDSFHNEPHINLVPVNHEQVAAMAGETYARFNGISAVITTNAPGALNLLNGIDGAWNDSIPCIFLCGQVNRSRWNRSKDSTKGREIVDIVTIVKSITKFAEYVEEPKKIKYYLDKAVHIATHGRPGPVLLDIPLDVQKADIDIAALEEFTPSESLAFNEDEIAVQTHEALRLIGEAQRPVVLLGGGIRLSGTMSQARQLVERLNIPAVATWCGFDILHHDHPNYFGNIGSYGNRRANFTIQNSDLVLILGARLNVRQTGGEPHTFAPQAKKIQIDLEGLEKASVKINLPIKANLRTFFDILLALDLSPLDIEAWRKRVDIYREHFSEVLPEYYNQEDVVNVYVFMKYLSGIVPAQVPVITDCGGNLIWTMQAYNVKENQRVFSNMGLSSMGYSLAASIGVCFANNRKPVVCIIGDGGLQVHIQELQVIKYHNLPIKIFVVNNQSYGIIKQTIESWFEIESIPELEKRCLAVSHRDGYSCPDFVKVAHAYGIPAVSIENHAQLGKANEVLAWEGPALCDVRLLEHQRIAPRLEFGRPLEDQHPLLDRKELQEIMIVHQESKGTGEIVGI
jgi:acetolactate synthase-1/2/3 large subunit